MKVNPLRPVFGRIMLHTVFLAFATSAGAGFVGQKPEKEIQNIIKRADVSTQGTNGSLRLVITSWKKRWECDTFNSCDSWFSGTAKMVRPDGTAVKWNLVESWAQDDCGANPQDTRWANTATNTESVYFGWGKKDGKSNHASAYLRFTNAEGVATAFVKSNTCP